MLTLPDIDATRPVLIAGPTASGKSSLALQIAARTGGVIVNADSIQVYDNWRVVSARPPAEDEAAAPHLLYGHVPRFAPYSTGHWLREVAAILQQHRNPIIVGGTGLYFTALTEGLAEIPVTPPGIRAQADAIMQNAGPGALLAELDVQTRNRIATDNPVRVQRAWEVLHTTGRGLAAWQDDTPAPVLSPDQAQTFVLNAPKPWLNPRIERRFDLMIEQGALDEARANLTDWDPKMPSSRAHGGPDLIDHLQGHISLETARERAIIITRRYAKRQRTWFRKKMSNWTWLDCETL